MRAKKQIEPAPAVRARRNNSLRTASTPESSGARFEIRRDTESDSAAFRRSGVHRVLDTPGDLLNQSIRPAMESQLGFDFSKVRIHNDAQSAQSAAKLNAEAYTYGSHVVFGASRFDANSSSGRKLLLHELTHVKQQSALGASSRIPRWLEPASSQLETDAEQASASRDRFAFSNSTQAIPGLLQRKVAMRDVGKGEQSGFARVPELVTRLNGMSTGLTFVLTGNDLTYTVKPSGKLSNFDTQMQSFIDLAAVIPLRFTNRHGLLGNKTEGFHEGVTEDAWQSGYVDIDDLLASSDLGMQSVLVHFLTERGATKNYAQRIGSESLVTDPATPHGAEHQAEFDRAHAKGIQAELAVLQDFFSDPTIRIVPGAESGQIFRVFRNVRRDTIRTRVRPGRGANAGVDAVSIEVVTRDGKVHTPEEYKTLIAAAPPPVPAGRAAAAPP